MLPVTLALAIVSGVLVPGMAAAQVQAGSTPADTTIEAQPALAENSTAMENNSAARNVSVGAMLSGVIATQEAEIRGAIAQQAFGLRIATAETSNETAAILARSQDRLQNRLQELQAELNALTQARENGSISRVAYRVRATAITTRLETVRELGNQTLQTAHTLPTEVLEANGVNVTAIRQLRMHARNLTGPEVSAIARQIAGPPVGVPAGGNDGARGPPADRERGPPVATNQSMTPANQSTARPAPNQTATHPAPPRSNTTAENPTSGPAPGPTAGHPTPGEGRPHPSASGGARANREKSTPERPSTL